jgi:hypothetical protein
MPLVLVSLGLSGVFSILHSMLTVVSDNLQSMSFNPIPNYQTIDP